MRSLSQHLPLLRDGCHPERSEGSLVSASRLLRSLFIVPLLIPLLVTVSNAAQPKKHHHKKQQTTVAAAAKAATTAKAAASPSLAVPAGAHGVRFGTSLGTSSSTTYAPFVFRWRLDAFAAPPSFSLPASAGA